MSGSPESASAITESDRVSGRARAGAVVPRGLVALWLPVQAAPMDQ